MEAIIATVKETTGNVYARASDGSLRALQSGDALFAGETIVTENGSNVTLDFGNNELVQLGDNQELFLPENILSSSDVSTNENAILDPSVEAVLAALEGDGDLLDDLEAPAAGVDGAPDGGGASFVQLTRIVETVDPLAVQFEQEFLSTFATLIGEQENEILTEVPVDPVDPVDPGPADPTPPPPAPSLTFASNLTASHAGSVEIVTASGSIRFDEFAPGTTYNAKIDGFFDSFGVSVPERLQNLTAQEIAEKVDIDVSQLNNLSGFGNPVAFDGELASMQLSLSDGMNVKFDWSFFNGENLEVNINGNKNDFSVLVVTDPDGNKQIVELAAGRDAFNQNPSSHIINGVFDYQAGSAGSYQFDWIVMNAGDTLKDSALRVSQPTFSFDGTDYFGQPVPLDISVTGVADQQLTVQIENVPLGSSFTSGIPLGGGVWEFTEDQLANLQWLPEPGYTGEQQFVVKAFSTVDGVQSEVVEAPLIVQVDIELYTDADFSNTNDSRVVDAFFEDEVIIGSSGDDIITGGPGNDLITGGAGNDIMFGGLGSDTFVWNLGDQGSSASPAIDIIGDFTVGSLDPSVNLNANNADVLNLSDLVSFGSGDDILNFLSIEQVGDDALLSVSIDGSGNVTQQIVLQGVSDLNSIGSSESEIISTLIQNGNLIVD